MTFLSLTNVFFSSLFTDITISIIFMDNVEFNRHNYILMIKFENKIHSEWQNISFDI